MSDHAHFVVEGQTGASDLRRFVALAKQYSGYEYSRANEGHQLWQRYSHERVLRSSESTQIVVRYVLENPVRKGLVQHPREYRFIGSSVYTLDELLEFAFGTAVAGEGGGRAG